MLVLLIEVRIPRTRWVYRYRRIPPQKALNWGCMAVSGRRGRTDDWTARFVGIAARRIYHSNTAAAKHKYKQYYPVKIGNVTVT